MISGSEKYSFELFFSDVCSGKTVNIKKTIQCTFVILFTFPVFSMTHYNDVHQCLSCHFSCSPGAVHHRGSSLLARVLKPFCFRERLISLARILLVLNVTSTGTFIPPPTRQRPPGSLKGSPVTLLQKVSKKSKA